jgi:hypothetical protein
MQLTAEEVLKAMAVNLSTSKTKSFGMNTLSLYLLRGVEEGFLGWHEIMSTYYDCEHGIRVSRSSRRLFFVFNFLGSANIL